MKQIFCLIIILVFPVFANSQPDYKYIAFDFDTLFILQTNDNLEMKKILVSYENSDSTFKLSKEDVQKSLDMIYTEWGKLDSLIDRANKLVFPNYSKDNQKISNLSVLIDSAIFNYKINLEVLKKICSMYSKFETENSLKTRFNDVSALRFPSFKPRTIK
jgi:hypothetical protein